MTSCPGKYATIKHYACNNQENNREYSNSNVSERALREIYLKGFEIAVRDGKARTIMTSRTGFQRYSKVMRGKNYAADMIGQLGLALMSNIVGQLTYFYTDKVGVAVGAVGVMMAIAKVIDVFTDVICGHIIDNSKGGDKKYFGWMAKMAIPAAIIMALMFTVPVQVGQGVRLIYPQALSALAVKLAVVSALLS